MELSKVYRVEVDKLHEPIQLPDSTARNVVEVRQEILPIIFVPGIMGSRLQNQRGNKVWDPDAATFMLGRYGLRWQNAKKRKKMLIGHTFDCEYLNVILNDGTHNRKFGDKTDKTRAKRGWGGVAWSSYGDFLLRLQSRQWDSMIKAYFTMPVHAFGYNWTACNGLAAEKLGDYVLQTIKHYADHGRVCKRVILVTHSMGGLVARAACKLPGIGDSVAGVVHGVQPAFGSAAGYWRMKGGFERPHTIPDLEVWQWLKNPSKQFHHRRETVITRGYDFGMGITLGKGNVTAWVLGSDGEEVTSLLGNMPGGLELLPTKDYRDNDGNKKWLVFINPDGKKVRLPKVDPYEEIYRNKANFYRLVNPKWLNPGGGGALPGNRDPWDRYRDYLTQAEEFHRSLGRSVHRDTYQFYSTGVASADRVVFVRTLDTLAAKGQRLLEIVKNEWFSKATSTTTDEVEGGLSHPLTAPVKQTIKQTLFHDLNWTDLIFHPSSWAEVAQRVPQAVKDVPGALHAAIDGYPTALSGAVKGLPEAVGTGLAVAAGKNLIGLLVRDTEWYINRGGYRDRVNEDLKPKGESASGPHEAVYVITMKTPNGAGDGTVPESSARALNPSAAAAVKFDKSGKRIKRTFSLGDKAGVEANFVKKKAPRTKPKSEPDFDEAWFDRGHEPVYKTKSAQHITFTAIENICRRRIAERVAKK